MKSQFKIFIIVVAIILISSLLYLYNEVEKSKEYIEIIETQVYDLESKIDELESKINDKNKGYLSNLELIEREKLLLEQQLSFHDTRFYETSVFYEVIRDTEFEDFIKNQTYYNYNNLELTKANVKIIGTENILGFLMHVKGKYELYYFLANKN